MRESLIESLGTRKAADVQFVAGSIVLCCACLKPLYVLQRSIYSGEKTSRTVDAYRPVTLADIAGMEARADNPGLAATVRLWSDAVRAEHVGKIPDVKTGSAALCPCCGKSWVRVRATSKEEFTDLAYVWELVTVLPRGAIDPVVLRALPMPEQVPTAEDVK
jgi:hypothetical protein